jgi:hypothetical protein
MNDDKKSSSSTNENCKVFNGELFVNNNSNEIDFDTNNNSLRKSISNSNGGSLSNNVRGSMKSSHSNNERFLTRSLIRDLRGSTKKFSDKKLEFDKLKLKEQQNQINDSQFSDNNNSNNNEEDFFANIKLQKNDNNQLKSIEDDDLYEDVEIIENVESEGNKGEVEEIENNNNIINEHKNEEMNDNININKLTKFNEYFNKNQKNNKKKADSKGNELDDILSLRSSGGSACISSHSNNSNSNIAINMNMRSSNIFNKKGNNYQDENQIKNNNNLIHLDEINSPEIENNNQNNFIFENNIINNEINENKDYKKEDKDKKEKESKEENERKEKIAKIKDMNNEKNFIYKNSINFGNKNININNAEEESKMELEMQLFNLDSLQSEKEKEKEKELNKLNIYPDFKNIMQTFEDSTNDEMPKIINIKKDEEKLNESLKEKEEEKIKEINNEFVKEEKKIEIKIEPQKGKDNYKEMDKEEYVFEKFGKLGWECEICNNFNFESRTICNRCEAPKQPKSLEQIKLENEQKSGEKKKKPLIERKGDWQCPLCHNLNFAFRVSCNRCKLPKEMYLNMSMKQQKINENINNNLNNQNNFIPQMPKNQIINNNGPQLIQNQYNIIQFGFLPIYSPYFSPNNFCQVQQQNTNMNNFKRKYKFYKQ